MTYLKKSIFPARLALALAGLLSILLAWRLDGWIETILRIRVVRPFNVTINHGPLSLPVALPATALVVSAGLLLFFAARRSQWFKALFPERAAAWLILVQASLLLPFKNGAIHNSVFLPMICLGFLCLAAASGGLSLPAVLLELPGRVKNMSGRTFQLVLMLLSLALGLAVAFGLFEQTPYVIDETVYLFQARIFAHGLLTAPPPGPVEFFYLPNLVQTDTAWTIQQAPGWPAILSLGTRTGLDWIVNPLLGALTALVAYYIGRKAADEAVGRLAGLLSLASPFVTFMNGSLMSHPASALFLGMALLMALRWKNTGSLPVAGALGLALGAGAAIRPFTAFLFGLPLVLWAAYHWFRDIRGRSISLIVMVGGAAIFISLLLFYNNAVHGSPLTFGYSVTHGEVKLLGFGQKYFPEPFTPMEAIRILWLRMTTLSRTLWALPFPPLVFVLLPFALRKAGPGQVLLAGVIAFLALGHMYYFFIEQSFPPRFLFAAWPPLLVLAAQGIMAGVERLSRLEEGMRLKLARGTALAVLFGVFVNLPLHAPFYVSAFTGGPHLKEAMERVSDPRPLVFVQPWYYEMGITLMDPVRLIDGPIFVRNLGEKNNYILNLYPDRRAYRFYNKPPRGFILEPYPPAR